MADLKALAEVLDFTALTEMYRQAANYDSTENQLYNFYASGAAERSETKKFQFIYDADQLKVAPFNYPDAKAHKLDLEALSEKEIELMQAFNTISLSGDALLALRDPSNNVLQARGIQEVRRQVEHFAAKHQRLRYLTLAKAFSGTLWVDAQGRILESSSNAVRTVSFGLPAGHTGALAKATLGVSAQLGAGNIIAANWDTTSADIFAQLDELRRAAMLLALPVPRHIWVNSAAKTWLRAQATWSTWAKANERAAEQVLSGNFAEDINGWTWHFWDGAYKNVSDAMAYYIPDTRAVITPDPGPWFTLAEGVTMVPTSLDIAQSAESALASLEPVQGKYAYAAVEHNPARLDVFMGDAFITAFKEPGAVWYPTVST
jgi:hypothetical protein